MAGDQIAAIRTGVGYWLWAISGGGGSPQTFFIHAGGWVGHIEDVAVHRDHQKKGIGAALIRHAVDEARKLGCYKVILSCFEDRVAFYEGLGFRPHDVGLRIDL